MKQVEIDFEKIYKEKKDKLNIKYRYIFYIFILIIYFIFISIISYIFQNNCKDYCLMPKYVILVIVIIFYDIIITCIVMIIILIFLLLFSFCQEAIIEIKKFIEDRKELENIKDKIKSQKLNNKNK